MSQPIANFGSQVQAHTSGGRPEATIVPSEEPVEYAGQVRCRNTQPVVTNLQQAFAIPFQYGDLNVTATFTVFDCVGQQLAHNHPKPFGVRLHGGSGSTDQHARIHFCTKPACLQLIDCPTDQVKQVNRRGLQIQLKAVKPRRSQHHIQAMLQTVSLSHDGCTKFSCPVIRLCTQIKHCKRRFHLMHPLINEDPMVLSRQFIRLKTPEIIAAQRRQRLPKHALLPVRTRRQDRIQIARNQFRQSPPELTMPQVINTQNQAGEYKRKQQRIKRITEQEWASCKEQYEQNEHQPSSKCEQQRQAVKNISAEVHRRQLDPCTRL